MQATEGFVARVEKSCAPVARALWLAAGLGLAAAGCDNANKPEPPYKDPPPNQRIKSQALLVQYQCGSCHQIPQVPSARDGAGPSLEGFGRRSYIAGEVPNSLDALSRWIVSPRALVPDTRMPSMGVSPQDAREMAAWLLALT